MRVTSELFVSALVRRVFSQGGFAAVVYRGADEAGAVFITIRDRLGLITLYGPAAQTSYEEARPQERLFCLLIESADEETISQKLAREMRFDPDLWVLELEPGSAKIEDYVTLTMP